MKESGKETAMIVSALVMLASGVGLSFLAFFLSEAHAIHDSVLWYFAQTIVYASSVFGIGAYVDTKIKKISTKRNGLEN